MIAVRLRALPPAIFVFLAGSCAHHSLVSVPAVTSDSCRRLIDGAGTVRADGLQWHTTDDPERRAPAWSCATVGPAVYEPPAQPTSPRRNDGIVVVSWNVHVGGGDLVTFIEDLRAGRLTDGTPPGDFVVLIQEAFRGGPAVPQTVAGSVPERIEAHAPDGTRTNVVAAARSLGLGVFYLPSMRNGDESGDRAEDRGNAILSTLPLTDLTAIELPFTRQRRVAAAATLGGVRGDGQPWRLRVVSLHLDASTGAKQLWLLSTALRERQAQHLVDVLDDEDLPTIVGSDLNTWAGGAREPAYAVMRREFRQSGDAARATFGRWLTLDYLFFRLPETWHGEARASITDFGSDHRPVVGHVRIGAKSL